MNIVEPSGSGGRRAKARLIVPLWGNSYLDKFLGVSLPSLLAPGNVPTLAEAFDTEFVLVTEQRLFEEIRQSRIFQALERICRAQLVPIDDLVCEHYGMRLTYALYRGFVDLGESMTDTYLFFLNSGWVLADGSYRAVVGHIRAGKRLIVAPTYCAVEEEAVGVLNELLANDALSVPPRRLAEIILRHLHNCVRGKIVNQQLFCMHRHDQFYWRVDEHTLLAHQMPNAVVCMKPERILEEPICFFDYGITHVACPTTVPTVMSDSDDFLAMALRHGNRFEDLLRVGWPTPDAIAADLSTYTTADYREHGRLQSVLHARSEPADVKQSGAQLRSFVDGVLARMSPEPISFVDHHYWTQVSSQLTRPLSARIQGSVAIAEPAANGDLAKFRVSIARSALGAWRHIAGPHAELRFVISIWSRDFFWLLFGRPPAVRRLHPNWLDFRRLSAAIDSAFRNAREPLRALVVARENSLIGTLLPVQTDAVEVTIEAVVQEGIARRWNEKAKFDVCVCELDYRTLVGFAGLYRKVRPYMRPGAKIIAFHINSSAAIISSRELIPGAFPEIDTSAISWTGSPLRSWASRILAWGRTVQGRSHVHLIAGAVAGLISAPFAFLGNIAETRSPAKILPKRFTSLLIEVDIEEHAAFDSEARHEVTPETATADRTRTG